jgi:hypothetical protein
MECLFMLVLYAVFGPIALAALAAERQFRDAPPDNPEAEPQNT